MITEAPRRLAVLSDIHGNMHALNAVLDSIEELDIATVICCGDVVGYGAYPNECCEALRTRGIPTVAGNHDQAVLESTDIKFFNDIAKAAIYWTRDQLSAENSEWLAHLRYGFELGQAYYFVHASPLQPEKWGYILTFGDARLCFQEFHHHFCFVGHSHQPAVVEQHGEELVCPEGMQIPIHADRRYLVNVGSVGQPRDHNPDACFVSLDMEAGVLEFHRVAYDVQAAQGAIRANDLPVELADRLAYGG